MNSEQRALLNHIYINPQDIYLQDISYRSSTAANATFIFGHNPRTADFTHVGAAEMLAGVSQAAYCLTQRYNPHLITEETLSRCFFKEVSIRFSKMLAPMTEASLTLEIDRNERGLPRFHFDGFVSGTVDCDITRPATTWAVSSDEAADEPSAQIDPTAQRILRSFYNNGSELTLKSFVRKSASSWITHSAFKPDARLKLCEYTTTTQLIVGLSQVAFAVVGDSVEQQAGSLEWSQDEFAESMSDQALVKLSYCRSTGTFQAPPTASQSSLHLSTTLKSARAVKGCKFIRLGLEGDLKGTMDNMLSPRLPVKSVRAANYSN